METRKLLNGTQIDVIRLKRISLAKLEDMDMDEINNLLSAAQSVGVCYLDFSGSQMGNLLIESLGNVYFVCQKYFDQDHASKLNDIRFDQKPSQDKGYKFCSIGETFEMPYDELVKSELELPEILNHSKHILKGFSQICHEAAQKVTQILSTKLSLPLAVTEEKDQRSRVSDSGLKLVYEPCVKLQSQVEENKHTDSGTCTLTFYDEWGLHVQLPNGKWGYAAPVPGCAVLNIADTFQQVSDGQLRSPVHRVTQIVDGFSKRYFLSYFLRPTYTFRDVHKCGL